MKKNAIAQAGKKDAHDNVGFLFTIFALACLCSSVWIECFPPKEEVMRSNRITGIREGPYGALSNTCDLEENATFDHRVRREVEI